MKIPESAAPSYYGEEPHWQGNGMMAESGGQYSGVSGAIPTPVYPPQIRGHMQPGYMGMSTPGAYYPVYPGNTAAPPNAGPLSPPNALPVPLVTPHQHNIDFAEYMWMENEEEFDKQVMQQLEEEALMEQCIEAMLEDERERQHHHRHNGRQTNGTESRAEASKSTLNPLAAEFVPGGGYAPASGPTTAPPPAPAPPLPAAPVSVPPTVTARSPTPPQPADDTTPTVTTIKEDSPIDSSSTDESRESSADEKSSETRPETPEEKVTIEPEPEVVKEPEEVQVQVEEVSAVVQPEEIFATLEKSSPIPEVEAHPPSVTSRTQQSSAWKEAPQSKSKRKPTMAEMVGGKKGSEKGPIVVSVSKTGREPKPSKSESKLSGASKGKEVKQAKSEPKFEQKIKEMLPSQNSTQERQKEEFFKQSVHASSENLITQPNHVTSSQNIATTVPSVQNAIPKPINYAAAAKAKVPSRVQSAPQVSQQPTQTKKPAK